MKLLNVPKVRRALAAAAMTLAVLAPLPALAAEGAGSTIANNKTVSEQKADGSYDLTLSVTGTSATTTDAEPVDVVLVIDKSGSMADRMGGWGSPTRWSVAEEAANNLAQTLLTESNAALGDKQIRVSLVSFDGEAYTSRFQSGSNWTADARDIENALNRISPDGKNGTNWQAGLQNANNLSTGRDGAQKYIVFLSDGEPNRPVTGWGSHTEENYQAALTTARQRDGATLFSIFAGEKNSSGESLMKQLAADTDKKYYDGTDEQSLLDAFKSIANEITNTYSYSEVAIHDKLSDSVKFASTGVANGVLTGYTAYKGGAVWNDAPVPTFENDEIVWNLGDVESGVEYKLVVNIKPTQAAFDAAAVRGSDQVVPTNAKGSGFVSYKESLNGAATGDAKTALMPEPEITIPVSTLTLTKAWNTNGVDGLTLPSSIDVTLSRNGEEYKTVTLQANENGVWTTDVVVPVGVASTEWTATEANVPGYDSSVSGAVTLAAFKKGRGRFDITNTYNPTSVTVSGEDALDGTKNLTGKDLAANDFTFVAKLISGVEGGTTNTDLTTKNNADGSFSFGPLTFSKPGTYTYKVTERNDGKGGYTYDTAEYTVTFNVADVNGALTVSRSSITKNGVAADAIAFNNSYAVKPVSTDTAGILGGTKSVTLTGENTYDLASNPFTFALSKDGAQVATTTNDADGSYEFPAQEFTAAGTYTYTVSEVAGSATGIMYDGAAYNVTFEVSDHNGRLMIDKATVTKVTGNGSAPAELGKLDFTNAYNPKKASYSIAGTKTLTNTSTNETVTPADGAFSFQLSEEGTVLQTVKNVGGTFAFSTIEYTEPGTHTYTVSEVIGSDKTVAYDQTVYTMTVEVTDKDGVLVATASADPSFAFKNTYTPTPVTVDPTADDTFIGGAKTLSGRDAKAGEFEFQLVDSAGTVIDTATNTAASDGQAASFGFTMGLTFDKAGTYVYTVREVNAGATKAGVTYDSSTFKVTITVTEDTAAHALVAEVSTPKEIAFTNTYQATGTTYTSVGATKTLTGRDLAAGEFTFQISNDNGFSRTATNDVSGNIDFANIPFSSAGRYVLTVAEVKGDDATITYDDATFRVVVNVVDDGLGSFKVDSVEYPDGEPAFANTYTAPEAPKDDTPKNDVPKTGDSSFAGTATLMVAAAALVGTGFVLHKRFQGSSR